MRFGRFLAPAAFAVALPVFFWGGRALAQVTGVQIITTTPVTRVASDGMTAYECPGRGSTNGCIVDSAYQGIGSADCFADSELLFPVQLSGSLPDTSGTLQVWAGPNDCTKAQETGNNTTASCWLVAQTPPLALTMSIPVRVADIAGWIGQPSSSLPESSYHALGTQQACTNAASGTTVVNDAGMTTTTAGETTVNVFFLWFANNTQGQAPLYASSAYPVKVKLFGPEACTDVTAQPDDGALSVGWTPPAGDTSVVGFNLYATTSGTTVEAGTELVCPDASQPEEDASGEDASEDAATPDASTDASTDASVVEAGPADSGCYTVILPPVTNACGSTTIDVSGISCSGGTVDASVTSAGGSCSQAIGATNTSGTITGLTNGTAYDVAVAAFDEFGNIGTISTTVCATPSPINDFWKIYNQDGGNAFCALEVVGKGGGRLFAGFVALVGIIFVRRRRKLSR